MESLIMENKQLSIWPGKELDFFAPRKKTKRDLNREKREAFKKKLLERAILSEDEFEKYNDLLDKRDLKREVIEYNEEIREKYEKDEMDYYVYRASIVNLGIPQMLFTTLSQFSNKNQDHLSVLDLIVMYNSINNVFPERPNYNELKKFRKANDLSFFGGSQYLIMERYLQNLT